MTVATAARPYGCAATEPMVATAAAALRRANETFWLYEGEAPEHHCAAAPIVDSAELWASYQSAGDPGPRACDPCH